MTLKKKISWAILIILAVIIKIISFYPSFIEQYYSNGFYPVISRFQRILFGWIPFSIGDFIYFFAAIYLLKIVVKFIKKCVKKQVTTSYIFHVLSKTVFLWLVIYVYFNIAWGLNYNRLGIATQLGINVTTYSTVDLAELTDTLISKLNNTQSAGLQTRNDYHKKRNLFNKAVEAYSAATLSNSFLVYKTKSVKPSLYSYFGNTLGFTGYYNPFSGEAQVNTTVPLFVQPFTTCHEIGHQLGYAKENEANFAGFLTTKNSTDSAFLYSLYFDLYSYCMRDLYRRDTVIASKLKKKISPQVRNDFLELQSFYKKYTNPVAPVITNLYGQYLKANEQPVGMLTYDEVVGMVIAYTKKYGFNKL